MPLPIGLPARIDSILKLKLGRPLDFEGEYRTSASRLMQVCRVGLIHGLRLSGLLSLAKVKIS